MDRDTIAERELESDRGRLCNAASAHRAAAEVIRGSGRRVDFKSRPACRK